MSEERKAKENEVFDQELSVEDLDAAAGGAGSGEEDPNNCIVCDKRNIYGGNGFPNCAATVEDDSWCGDNDACLMSAVDYQGMKHCPISWG